MRPIRIAVWLALVPLAACAAGAPQTRLADETRPGMVDEAVPAHHLDPAALDLWRDPSFQRRFTESYIAETEVEPSVTMDERDTMQKVLDYMQQDRLDKAIVLLDRNRSEADSAVFDFTLANIYFQQDEFERAIEIYKIAVRKYPKFRRAYRNMALINVRTGTFDEAVANFTKVIELGGGDAITYGLLGYSYSSLGDMELPAETAYRMAILLDPGTIDWKMGLARSLFKQQRFADAAALCDQLIAADPERSELWLLQANAYIGLERPVEAAKNYEVVDRLGDSTAQSLSTLGDIYVNEALYEMAVDAYRRAMDLDPDGRIDRVLRAAKVLAARSAYDETAELVGHIDAMYGASLETAERKDLLKLRARVAVARGAGDEEAAVLEEIVALDPLDGEALILLGQHSARSGNPEQAVFYYERAESIEGYEADAKVRHAQLLVGEGKYREALPLLRSAQQIKPRESVQDYLDQVERVANLRAGQ